MRQKLCAALAVVALSALGFVMIWLALAVYMADSLLRARRTERR